MKGTKKTKRIELCKNRPKKANLNTAVIYIIVSNSIVLPAGLQANRAIHFKPR